VKSLLIHQAFLPSHDQAPYEPRPAAHVRHPDHPDLYGRQFAWNRSRSRAERRLFAGLALNVNHVV
jgi:hypothetical protein